jgi:hypothetical protein
LLLISLLLVSFFSLFASPATAYCKKPSLGLCMPGTDKCAPPIDYLCCSDVPECEGMNPFCTTSGGQQGIKTAIGCIATFDPKVMIGQILIWGAGMGGMAAFLVIVFGGFLIMTASGNIKQVTTGREYIMAAVLGLTLIVFSLLILNFLGVNILGLTGFGFSF